MSDFDLSSMLEGLQIELVATAGLIPYARNSKKHADWQIDKIAASMKEFGWTQPILIDRDGVIIAGHGRLMAAQKLGLDKVPTIRLEHLTDAQRKALVIWDNRSAEIGTEWDVEFLRVELEDLKDSGFDLELTGFDEAALAEMFGDLDQENQNDRDPEDVPEPPAEPVSRLGDIWVIGAHRVMCGSSLEHDAWDRLMGHDYADCVFTDPPYGVSIGEKNDSMAKAQGRTNKTGGILNDDLQGDGLYKFLLPMFECVRDRMKPGAPIYVYHADTEGLAFRTAFRDAGFKLQSILQWRKNTFVLSRWDMHPITEPCLYGWKTGAGHKWYGGRKQSTFFDLGDGSPFEQLEDGTWRVVVGDTAFIVSGEAKVQREPSNVFHEPKPAKSELHPTMKPVSLVMRHLKNSARQGDLVVDAFGGSGSTAIAAHKLAMKSCLMELDPKYVDVIALRLWQFTGVRPVNAVTGNAFPGEGERRWEDEPVQSDCDVF